MGSGDIRDPNPGPSQRSESDRGITKETDGELCLGVEEDAHVFELAKRKIPIGIWVGDGDAYYPLDVIRDTKKMFEDRGFTIALEVIPNHNHDYYTDSYRVNKGAWDFLSKVELKEQKFQEYLAR